MRVAIAIYGSLDLLTGGWIYDRLLVDHLREKGHHVEVVPLKQRRYLHNLGDNFSTRPLHPAVNRGCRLLIEDALCHPSLIGPNRRLRKSFSLPIVSIVHQVLCRQPAAKPLQRIYQTVERLYFRSVDGFIYNSQTTRADVESLLGRRSPSVVACPGGDRLGKLSSPAEIESRCRSAGPVRLISVCNLTPNKGILPMIAGLSRLPPESWQLTIVGSLSMDPGYARRVKASIARLGLGDSIEMAGPLDGEDLAVRLDRSHIFVLPFSREAFGMACLEAMGRGLPVIGSSSGAVGEFVRDGTNGALIAPGDIDAFVEAVHHLHIHRKQLADCGRAALQTFSRRPGWRQSLERIHSFLLSITDGSESGDHARIGQED